MWYETSSLNLMVAPRYVGAMVSIRSLSDFDLQADKLAGPRPSEALRDGVSGICFGYNPDSRLISEMKIIG